MVYNRSMNSVTMIGAADVLPDNPVIGAIVYRTDLGSMFVYTGTVWAPMTVNTTKWHLFLDDERNPADAGWAFSDIVVARSSREAVVLVTEKGLPASISFDHDLGGDDTAFKFMWWLINGHLDEKWNLQDVNVVQIHSANPEGAKKLIALWDNFCRVHKIDTTISRVWPNAEQ